MLHRESEYSQRPIANRPDLLNSVARDSNCSADRLQRVLKGQPWINNKLFARPAQP